MEAYALTDTGRVRSMNQDYIYASPEKVGFLPDLFLVADGMGGHKAGDYASRFMVENLVVYLNHRQNGPCVTQLKEGIKTVNKALYEMDNDPAGFEWINADDIFRSIYSFVRHSKNKEKNLLFVCNFTPVEREDYRVGVPTRKTLKLVLNSDEEKYGGKGEKRPLTYKPVKKECDGQAYSIAYPLPAYGVAVFEY